MAIDPISSISPLWEPSKVTKSRTGEEGGTDVDRQSEEDTQARLLFLTADRIAEAVAAGILSPDMLIHSVDVSA